MTKHYVPNYPRPQFVRSNWQDLCGKWFFRFDDSKAGLMENWHKGFSDQEILVPFTYETKMSGIGKEEHHECVWYSRSFEVVSKEGDVLLHFEGSDYLTTVWINGYKAGSHTGGYTRFSFEISRYLEVGENTITVRCEDSPDKYRPRGKQRWIDKNYGCWYVQTTGIWKQVWLENVPATRIENVKITPDLDNMSVSLGCYVSDMVNFARRECYIDAEISFKGQPIAYQRTKIDREYVNTVIDISSKSTEWEIHAWAPGNPNLYDIDLKLFVDGKATDEVGSYFGLRKIGIKGNKVLLNNRPVYQKLILDQGYWPESGLTPPSEDALIEDIDKILELGFNGLRKHQKTEDERFAYWCDVKGLLMWCETPAAYLFNDLAIERFTREWMEIVRQYYNHPSIIVWTPFNESWGVPQIRIDDAQQCFVTGIYNLTKAFDTMRPVVTNDGWEHTCSDIVTLHDYEQNSEKLLRTHACQSKLIYNEANVSHGRYTFANGWEYKGQPVIMSEYGGIAIKGRDDEGWGYGDRVEDESGLEERYAALTKAIMKMDYMCGFCYTQVTDVQQEVNGLMDMQRNFKCDPEAIKRVNDAV